MTKESNTPNTPQVQFGTIEIPIDELLMMIGEREVNIRVMRQQIVLLSGQIAELGSRISNLETPPVPVGAERDE